LPYKIEYKSSVVRDLKKLDKSTAKRILQQLEVALSKNPNCGAPLTGQFKGLFKYRIGDYRIIYTKIRDGVLILRIAHRSKVYK
jgi:mRNA interferase RelE/StbE